MVGSYIILCTYNRDNMEGINMEGQQVDTAAVTDLAFDHIVTMNNNIIIVFLPDCRCIWDVSFKDDAK